MHCKFQPLVFNIFWENDFSTVSPYRSMGSQIWHCCKKIKGHPRIIIWTNLIDIEPPILRFSLKAFLFRKKKIFLRFLPYMGMAAILFNGAEPFEQIDNTPWVGIPMWQLIKRLQRRKRLKITQFYTWYSPEARADNPNKTKLKGFATWSYIVSFSH